MFSTVLLNLIAQVQQKSQGASALPIDITGRTYISSALVAVPSFHASSSPLTSCHAVRRRPLHDSACRGGGTLLAAAAHGTEEMKIRDDCAHHIRSMHAWIGQRQLYTSNPQPHAVCGRGLMNDWPKLLSARRRLTLDRA